MRKLTFVRLIADGRLDASKVTLQNIHNFNGNFEGLHGDRGVEPFLQLSKAL